MAIIRNFRLPVGIGMSVDYIETFGVIQSTTPSNGAIVSRGGVGVGNSISIGGRLQLFNGANYTAFVSSASGNTLYTLPASSPATGSSVLQSTSAGLMSWVPMATSGAASGFTTLNTLTSGIQYFSTGTSGSGFNISSSGSTHTFNIPIAGSGSTGLITTQSQTIAGQKTFTSAILGDLTGTATTSGFATTASYSYQSGYGITAGLATTSTYSHQAGYAITSGSSATASTATYSHQSGYGITAGLATTATYSHQSGYAITSGSSVAWATPRTLNLSGDLSGSVIWSGSGDTTLTATIVANSVALGTDTTGQYASAVSISGSGITATASNADDSTAYTIYSSATASNTVSSIVLRDGSGNFSAGTITANLTGTATTATYSHQSGYAITSGFATTSSYSYQSGYGLTSGTAITAQNINVVLASTSASHQLLFTPTSGSASGVAVSSNSTLVYNPSTDIVSVSGLAITATTNSTSSSTGALIVSGGVGVGGSSHFNSTLHITSTINSTSTSTGALIVDGGIGVSKDIYLGGTVLSGSWAGNAITGRYGGTGYTTYTKGDLIVGAGGTFIKVGIGASHQVLGYSATSASGLGWTDLSINSPISTNYGCFYSTVTQPVLGANTITPVTLNSTYEAANIEIYGGAGTSSRIRMLYGGVYNIQLSCQMNLSSGAQPKVGDFWFRINGTDVPWSNSKQTILGQDNQHIFSLNFVSTFSAGQYFELMMNSDNDKFILEATAAGTGPTRPATPSVIFTVTKVL